MEEEEERRGRRGGGEEEGEKKRRRRRVKIELTCAREAMNERKHPPQSPWRGACRELQSQTSGSAGV